MDIYAISEKTGVSLRILRRIEKAGYLNSSKCKNEILAKTRMTFSKNNRPTVEQFSYFLRHPEDIKYLGVYASKMHRYIYFLGPVVEERMPWIRAQDLIAASQNDGEAKNRVADWVAEFIDRSPAFNDGRTWGHPYLAVRILADVPDDEMKAIASAVANALSKCRHSRRLFGYWHIDPETKRTRYHRPKPHYDL